MLSWTAAGRRQQLSHAVALATATSPRCPCNISRSDSRAFTLRLRTPAGGASEK
jgi:hypothetical protein